MPVIALDDDRERATQVLEAEIRTAIREDFINSVVLGCAIMVHMTDNQIAVDADSVAALQKRVDAANQDITDIRSQMSSKFKPVLEFQNVSNQVFALELTIDGLDKEIDNLDMRAAGAEGKLNRFIRACKREPACKSALNL